LLTKRQPITQLNLKARNLRKREPDTAELVEELQGVDALLIGEVDDAVNAVVLNHL
jgi:hypothetical protein